MLNALTIDVEEYFHPAEIQASVGPEQWDTLPSRVEDQVLQVLELLAQNRVTATFFILGWVAERHPRCVRAIVAAGHEIGCHSYAHQLVYRLTPAAFRRDTVRAVNAIEDACGVSPWIYRAPSYSITGKSLWALETLIECGFTHDSSIYPITHDRYGIPGFERHAHSIHTPSGFIQEIPAATVKISQNRVMPVGGGAYLRLLPYRYTSAGVRRLNRDEEKPACIYFHPWEIDPDQPKLASGTIARLRTYSGMKGMAAKLNRLMSDFQFCTIGEVYGKPASLKPVIQTETVGQVAAAS
ncbi:MAG: XrtA system polysaccharide deacetylase [Bryobacteraceae bacterium]|jgi:polysaccharide deacetylase family protein (PEP-CTERM system associated)